MLGGFPWGLLIGNAVPFFVLGLGLLVWFMVRSVPPSRWRQPGHWLKALLLAGFAIPVLIVPIGLLAGLILTALLR